MTRYQRAAIGTLGTCLTLGPLVAVAIGSKPDAARYPLVLHPDALARGGAVLTAASDVNECAWRGFGAPGRGGAVIGIASCDGASVPGGWLQLEHVFEDPHRPTVLAVRITPPTGATRSIQSLRRDGRARILFDGKPIWETRAASDDGTGHYLAIAEADVLTTLVIRGRGRHTLRFETEPGVTWNVGMIELAATPAPRSLKGLAYSPYRDCQAPGGARQPSAADIEDDLFRMSHSSTAIRTYSAVGVNARIVAGAQAAGQPVYAGAWLDRIPGDEAELAALIDLARTARPEGYIVGNEFTLRHRNEGSAAIDYLLDRIRKLKAALPARHAPVMTADVDGVMFELGCDSAGIKVKGIARDYEPILDATDAVLVHIYPFWDGRPIAGAAALAAARYVAIREFIRQRYPGKRVILGETGWPSAGTRVGEAVPGREAQRRYMAEFLQLADAKAIDYFYFDAFDEGWKIDEPGHVGQHWGYADSTRAAKYDIASVLIPGPLLASIVAAPAAALPSCHMAARPTSGAVVAADPLHDDHRDPQTLYSDWWSDDSRFTPEGWMGDTDRIEVFECDRSTPHGGDMAIRARFSPDGKNGWGGVVWRDPASDRGAQPGGRDLRSSDRLRFWVKGERGGEVVEFRVGGVGSEHDRFRDTVRPARSSGPLVLSGDWQPVTIGLGGADLSRVVGGFSWFANRCQNSQPITFFIDDIRFEAAAPDTAGQPVLARRPFHVYDDDGSGCGHYVPSGFMGDFADLTVNARNMESPFKGRTAIQVTYRPGAASTSGWAGVYWQDPAGNWGMQDGGFDLSWATILTFHARGRQGGETLEFIAGGLGRARDRYRDSLFPKQTTGVVHLTKDWQRYSIDLRGRDLRRIAGGFGFVLNATNNPGGAEFFLDEIAYQKQ